MKEKKNGQAKREEDKRSFIVGSISGLLVLTLDKFYQFVFRNEASMIQQLVTTAALFASVLLIYWCLYEKKK